MYGGETEQHAAMSQRSARARGAGDPSGSATAQPEATLQARFHRAWRILNASCSRCGSFRARPGASSRAFEPPMLPAASCRLLFAPLLLLYR